MKNSMGGMQNPGGNRGFGKGNDMGSNDEMNMPNIASRIKDSLNTLPGVGLLAVKPEYRECRYCMFIGRIEDFLIADRYVCRREAPRYSPKRIPWPLTEREWNCGRFVLDPYFEDLALDGGER